MSTALFLIVAAALWAALMTRLGLVAARMYQIEEYEGRRFLAWALQPAWLSAKSVVMSSLALVLVAGVAPFTGIGRTLLAAVWCATASIAHAFWDWLAPKKELAFTSRMRRLLAASATLAGVWLALAALAAAFLPVPLAAWTLALFSATLPVMVVVIGIAANTAMGPVEGRVNRGYVRSARERMQNWDPLVVAVAGSYGKTSTKHIIWGLIEDQVQATATPKSFNTLMGVTRTINENLDEGDRVFIVEMDAYAPGEIAAICALTPPQIAVVTSVGPQHLERFGIVDRIADALYECIEPLPIGQPAVVYCGDPLSAKLAERAAADGHRVVRYGMEGDDTALDVLAADLRVDDEGSHFTWRWDAEDLTLKVSIPLLGAHNVLNTSAALAVVHLLGYKLDAAAAVCKQLAPVPHRLETVPTANNIRVIDDSYNANPVGVHNGLDVLARFEGRKILVTPGMVELGSVEDAENRRYGEHAAKVCDDVILMLSHPAAAVREGLVAGGMERAHVHEVATLDEATAVIGRIAKPGDTVLFANDLPDTYL